uniref:Uncharacterized protein n=1 Tax=Peronospora matthiolae TaxID=2874970 RepID=A0AAV1TUF5_9STRA
MSEMDESAEELQSIWSRGTCRQAHRRAHFSRAFVHMLSSSYVNSDARRVQAVGETDVQELDGQSLEHTRL